MTKISEYTNVSAPSLSDRLVGTDVDGSNATKNFLISDVLGLSEDDISLSLLLQSTGASTHYLKMKAAYAFDIQGIVLQASGNVNGVSIKIGGTDVTGLTGMDVTTSISSHTATALNQVEADDVVTLVVTTADAINTILNVQLNIKRT